MPEEFDPVDDLHEASFEEGQKAVARDRSKKRLIEQLHGLADLGVAAGEAMTRLDQLAKDGDPQKRKIAEQLKAAIAGTATGKPQAAERSDTEEADPLSVGSPRPTASLPSSTTISLPSKPAEPSKRKRGRPPKNRTD